ncbi:calpain-type cysteine protease DEK1 [Prunus yedoensis var. nudiflora]|uniref:Calpain-type cysteine protease DEK1 n=1 Tax=Prunus yedoensis var. nudiflora TaxID=2094558 RepID=A0A314U6V0_PRUYE|nr:calpain-type cysteine protease DEK1 [Prunus yedoensis var. nudiflora]
MLAKILKCYGFCFSRKDDECRLSRVVYIFGLLLLLGSISAVIVVVKPWTGLLSPPIVVYSPRVLPVYVYDAYADCGKNVSAAFLVLHGIALVTEGWGVVAILKFLPPFAGASLSAITLVVAFGFAFSRPCLTLKVCVLFYNISLPKMY